jgi:hypothetical protein
LQNELLTDVVSGYELQVTASASDGWAKLTVPTGVVNHGVIRLVSATDDGYERSAALDIQAGTLVNAYDAILHLALGAGDNRYVRGNIVNQGQIVVDEGLPYAAFENVGQTPALFRLEGGYVLAATSGRGLEKVGGKVELVGGAISGIFRGSGVSVATSGNVTGEFRLVRWPNTITQAEAEGLTIWLDGNTTFGAVYASMAPHAINRGILRLETTSNDSYDRSVYLNGAEGFVNAPSGRIYVNVGAGDDRSLLQSIINQGAIVIEPGTSLALGTYIADGGTIVGSVR